MVITLSVSSTKISTFRGQEQTFGEYALPWNSLLSFTSHTGTPFVVFFMTDFRLMSEHLPLSYITTITAYKEATKYTLLDVDSAFLSTCWCASGLLHTVTMETLFGWDDFSAERD
eukprot:scaffold6439_cov131-Skeletonema_menzelii.AAC.2